MISIKFIIIAGIIIGIIFYFYDKDGFDFKLDKYKKITNVFKRPFSAVNFSSALEGIVVFIFILFILPTMFPGPTKWFIDQENSFLIIVFFLSCILGLIYLPKNEKEEGKKEEGKNQNHEEGNH